MLEGILKYPAVFGIAFIITYLCVPLIRSTALALGIIDRPGFRRIHSKPTPRSGGIAVFLGFHLACIVLLLPTWNFALASSLNMSWWLNLFYASSLLLIDGVFDDRFGLPWWVKLAAQIVAATWMFSNGSQIERVLGYELPDYLSYIATIGWFVLITNAFNLIDGLDGLAAGLACVACLGLGGASLLRGMPGDVMILMALLGACLAFLRFNFHPASIFLGDSGSMFLGFTLASIGLTTTTKGSAFIALSVPLLAVGVPMFDTILAVWRRSVRMLASRQTPSNSTREAIVAADMDHLHHRLLQSRLNQRHVAVTLYLLNFALVGMALLSLAFHSYSSAIALMSFLAGFYVLFKHLARVELWDSGKIIIHGLRRPSKPVLAFLMYVPLDFVCLAGSLLLAILSVERIFSFNDIKIAFFDRFPIWCSPPFIALAISGCYSKVWSRARISDFVSIAGGITSGIVISAAISLVTLDIGERTLLLSMLVYWSFLVISICGLRALPRAVQDLMEIFDRGRLISLAHTSNRRLIIGAGTRGILFLRHATIQGQSSEAPCLTVGFVDDDRNLRKRFIHGYQVLGTLVELPDLIKLHHISEIILAADISLRKRERLLEFAKERMITIFEWNIERHLIYQPKDLAQPIANSPQRVV